MRFNIIIMISKLLGTILGRKDIHIAPLMGEQCLCVIDNHFYTIRYQNNHFYISGSDKVAIIHCDNPHGVKYHFGVYDDFNIDECIEWIKTFHTQYIDGESTMLDMRNKNYQLMNELGVSHNDKYKTTYIDEVTFKVESTNSRVNQTLIIKGGEIIKIVADLEFTNPSTNKEVFNLLKNIK